jgi:hypothetical protein
MLCRGTGALTRALFCLAARFATAGRGISALLKKLLFAYSEDEFLTAVATRE